MFSGASFYTNLRKNSLPVRAETSGRRMLAIFLTCANVFDETSSINKAHKQSHNSMVFEVGIRIISRSYSTKLECIYIFLIVFCSEILKKYLV